jgi:hypothetical protein
MYMHAIVKRPPDDERHRFPDPRDHRMIAPWSV